MTGTVDISPLGMKAVSIERTWMLTQIPAIHIWSVDSTTLEFSWKWPWTYLKYRLAYQNTFFWNHASVQKPSPSHHPSTEAVAHGVVPSLKDAISAFQQVSHPLSVGVSDRFQRREFFLEIFWGRIFWKPASGSGCLAEKKRPSCFFFFFSLNYII